MSTAGRRVLLGGEYCFAGATIVSAAAPVFTHSFSDRVVGALRRGGVLGSRLWLSSAASRGSRCLFFYGLASHHLQVIRHESVRLAIGMATVQGIVDARRLSDSAGWSVSRIDPKRRLTWRRGQLVGSMTVPNVARWHGSGRAEWPTTKAEWPTVMVDGTSGGRSRLVSNRLAIPRLLTGDVA